jgi:hypothetical protein
MKRFTAVALLVLSTLGLVGAQPGRASSNYCNDGLTSPGGKEVALITSPITLGVEVGTNPPNAMLCYSTGSPGAGNTVTGGDIHPYVGASPTSGGAIVFCGADPNVVVPVNCNNGVGYTASPTYSVSGGLVSVNVPFSVCTGGCFTTNPAVASTGVIVGTLAPTSGPSGTTGAGYGLSKVEVWLNGALIVSRAGFGIAGVYADTGNGPVYENLHGNPAGPCVLGVCLPLSGVVKTTGSSPTVYLLLPGSSSTTPITVPIPPLCIYNNNDPTPCP